MIISFGRSADRSHIHRCFFPTMNLPLFHACSEMSQDSSDTKYGLSTETVVFSFLKHLAFCIPPFLMVYETGTSIQGTHMSKLRKWYSKICGWFIDTISGRIESIHRGDEILAVIMSIAIAILLKRY